MSNNEIAHALNISPLTVKKHNINIYRKLNVHSRYEVVPRARVIGLIFDLL
jgi:ATP/maltotriose-dependent transcriptional regulator MalT